MLRVAIDVTIGVTNNINEQHTMKKTFEVTQELDLCPTLDFDSEEGLVLDCAVYNPLTDEPDEIEFSFEGLVDLTIEVGRFSQDYNTLYCIAHELNRHAERLRTIASGMEDSTQIEDLFKVDVNDLPEVDD